MDDVQAYGHFLSVSEAADGTRLSSPAHPEGKCSIIRQEHVFSLMDPLVSGVIEHEERHNQPCDQVVSAGAVGDVHVVGSSFQTVEMVCKTKDLSLKPTVPSFILAPWEQI